MGKVALTENFWEGKSNLRGKQIKNAVCKPVNGRTQKENQHSKKCQAGCKHDGQSFQVAKKHLARNAKG